MQFFGGRVCLDFANTLDWRTSENPQELIPDYESFLDWSVRRGTLPSETATSLGSRAGAKPATAEEVMSHAHSLRAQIWKIAAALREHQPADLSTINAAVVRLPPQPPLRKQKNVYLHDLPADDLRAPLWPVLWSLTAVLTSTDATRIGCCQAVGCGWFYVDESPNRTRMWCSSEVCGNRERARRAYVRRSQQRTWPTR
jgi:predicted RNA-binding Zn ribbon-like protein